MIPDEPGKTFAHFNLGYRVESLADFLESFLTSALSSMAIMFLLGYASSMTLSLSIR